MSYMLCNSITRYLSIPLKLRDQNRAHSLDRSVGWSVGRLVGGVVFTSRCVAVNSIKVNTLSWIMCTVSRIYFVTIKFKHWWKATFVRANCFAVRFIQFTHTRFQSHIAQIKLLKIYRFAVFCCCCGCCNATYLKVTRCVDQSSATLSTNKSGNQNRQQYKKNCAATRKYSNYVSMFTWNQRKPH